MRKDFILQQHCYENLQPHSIKFIFKCENIKIVTIWSDFSDDEVDCI
jgi:hypothetical protein